VVEWHTAAGNLVEDGELLGRVADLSRVWVWCEVHPGDLPLASRLVLPAAAVVLAGDGAPLEGRLDLLSPLLDEALGVFKARLVLDNPQGTLRPGMVVGAVLKVPDGVPTVEVPASAVLENEGQTFVFVRDGLLWVKRPVTVAATEAGLTRVTKGLAAGEVVASQGAFYLKSDILREKMGAGCAD
jgi:cobalt-zinc-cadmium efflux system membrane fusion protein